MADVNRGNRPLSPHLIDLSSAIDVDDLHSHTDYWQRDADRGFADRLVVLGRRDIRELFRSGEWVSDQLVW